MDKIIGYLFLLLFIPLAVYLASKNVMKQGLIIFLVIAMIIAGVFLLTKDRVTKLALGGGEILLDIEKAKADINIIDSLKTKMLSDYEELVELRDNFNSVFEITDDTVNMNDVTTGIIHAQDDGQIVNLVDMPISDITNNIRDRGYSFNINGEKIMSVTSKVDKVGDLSDRKVSIKGNIEIVDVEKGLILTSSNGKRWSIKLNNDGKIYAEELILN